MPGYARPVTYYSRAHNVNFISTTGLASTNIQSAIDELNDDKAPLDSPAFTGTITQNGQPLSSGGGGGDTASPFLFLGT
jgi:hypothetical protein